MFISTGEDAPAVALPAGVEAHVRVPERINLAMRERIRALEAKGSRK